MVAEIGESGNPPNHMAESAISRINSGLLHPPGGGDEGNYITFFEGPQQAALGVDAGGGIRLCTCFFQMA
jgi:hypothetical protein